MNEAAARACASMVFLAVLTAGIGPVVCARDYWVRSPYDATQTPCDFHSIQAAVTAIAVTPGDKIKVQGYPYNNAPTPSPTWVYNEMVKVVGSGKDWLEIIGVASSGNPGRKPVIQYDFANTATPTPTGSLTATPTGTLTNTPVPNMVTLDARCSFSNFRVSCRNASNGPLAGIMIVSPCYVSGCDVDSMTTGTDGIGIDVPCVSNTFNDAPPVIDSCNASGNYKGFASGEHEAVFQYCSAVDNEIGFGLDVGSCARVTNCWVERNDIGIQIVNDYYDCTPSATPEGTPGASPSPTPACTGWRNPGFVEISNVTAKGNHYQGVHIKCTAGDNPSPLVPVIRDSVIFNNGGDDVNHGCGIYCEGSLIYPTLKYNDVWNNGPQQGAICNYIPSDLFKINSFSANPNYTNNNSGRNLMQSPGSFSPCVDRGSMSLEAGTAITDLTLDTGLLDLGYHLLVPPEDAPGNLSAAAGDAEGTIEAAWTTPRGEQPVVYFRVSLLTTELEEAEKRITTANSYTFTCVASGTYALQVCAVNTSGRASGIASAEVSL
jgi:hypothetical protein